MNWSDLQPLLKTFRFAAPWLLLLLLLIPLWAWLRGRFSPVAAVSFSSGELLRSAARQAKFRRKSWLAAFRYLALTLLLLALARPQVEKGIGDEDAKGINIMLVMDFSGTMKTKDFMMENKKVSRADALIKVIGEFLRARPKDKIGALCWRARSALQTSRPSRPGIIRSRISRSAGVSVWRASAAVPSPTAVTA